MSSEQQARSTPPGRRRSPSAVASVAAAVLLVGGGGAYWASTAGDGGAGRPGGAGAAPPPLALDGYTDAGSGGTGSAVTSPAPTGSGPAGIAPGEPDPHGGGSGQVVYRAAGELPEGPRAAPVHRAQGTVGADEVNSLARALDVTGTPRLSAGSWLVGALPDGSGAQLRVGERAPGTWNFARGPQDRGSTDCVRGKQCVTGTPVGEEAAKKAAAPVLKALGLADAELDAGQVLGGARVVNADPVVGGLPTYGWTTGLPVGPDGRVLGGSGQLKGLTKGAEYPVVDAARALELLNDAGRGAAAPGPGDCTGPVPAKETGLARGPVEPERPVEPVPPVEPNPPVEPVPPQEPEPPRGKVLPCAPRQQVPPRVVTVESAVFGLAAQYADGQQMLVPSWLFRVRPTGDEKPYTVTYPAVDPRFLVTPAPPKAVPTAGPTTDPTAGPGTTPDRHVESYRTDGRKLSLTFWGGACSDYTAKAAEEGGAVRVRIVETDPDPGRICVAVAKELTETVSLDRPLAGRSVVGDDGRSVPEADDGKSVPKA